MKILQVGDPVPRHDHVRTLEPSGPLGVKGNGTKFESDPRYLQQYGPGVGEICSNDGFFTF